MGEKTLRTLEDYKNTSIEDLYMAVVFEYVQNASITDEESAKELARSIAEDIIKNGLTQKKADAIESELRESTNIHVNKRVAVLLKVGNKYLDVTDECKPLDKVKGPYIEELEPFEKYYAKDEYTFVEEDGKIYIDVQSMAPIEEYEREMLSKE